MRIPVLPLLTPQIVGRYALYGEIASGGMATVQFGRLLGEAGFQRTVAIKRLHPQFASDEHFVQQFLNEARLAARISHPNVVQTFDVVRDTNELLLVMEYVHGETLSHLLRNARQKNQWIPEDIGLSVLCDALRGLHAAHDAVDDTGAALEIVHRDISPENIVVDTEGRAKVLDFGIAKAQGAAFATDGGQLKGKFRYMSPEQVAGKKLDRRSDIFAMGITLFRVLTTRQVFGNQRDAATMLYRIIHMPVRMPSMIVPSISAALDAVVMKALDRDPKQRFATAEEFAFAIEEAAAVARPRDVGVWVEGIAGPALKARAEDLRKISAHSQSGTFRIQLPGESARVAIPVAAEFEANEPVVADGPVPVETSSLAIAHVWPTRPREVVVEYAPTKKRQLAWVVGVAVLLAFALGVLFNRFSSVEKVTGKRATQRDTTLVIAPKPASPPSVARTEPIPTAVPAAVPSPTPVETISKSSLNAPKPIPEALPRRAPNASARSKVNSPSAGATADDPLSRRH